ncbi:tat pathway signal sequence [Duganella sp. Root336D2]|nr:tat pathway signal sequence [Duganella sp. Root336D2]
MAGNGQMKRRSTLRLLAACAAAVAAPQVLALTSARDAQVRLSQAQSRAFQAWMLRIISAQVEQGPSPRWQHRDCAGLVRFAVNEALSAHDARWMRANGIASDRRLPPELDLTPQQAALRNRWLQGEGKVGAFVTALALVQHNSRFVAREISQALPGDLLFYDQGDEQHLMVWMGAHIAYHTGTVTPTDNGLRTVDIQQLTTWKDTRWQPAVNNPNFAGVFRLSFLS